jgi:hypothetical protein
MGSRVGQRAGRVAVLAGVFWLLGWSAANHAALGFTLLGGRFNLPVVTGITGWPSAF